MYKKIKKLNYILLLSKYLRKIHVMYYTQRIICTDIFICIDAYALVA